LLLIIGIQSAHDPKRSFLNIRKCLWILQFVDDNATFLLFSIENMPIMIGLIELSIPIAVIKADYSLNSERLRKPVGSGSWV
jgi:hypothetical protein